MEYLIRRPSPTADKSGDCSRCLPPHLQNQTGGRKRVSKIIIYHLIVRQVWSLYALQGATIFFRQMALKLPNQMILNPLTTIYFECRRELDARDVAKAITLKYHKGCGYVRNVFCHQNRVFVVFEGQSNTVYDYIGK